jgi:hypothetical protein
MMSISKGCPGVGVMCVMGILAFWAFASRRFNAEGTGSNEKTTLRPCVDREEERDENERRREF